MRALGRAVAGSLACGAAAVSLHGQSPAPVSNRAPDAAACQQLQALAPPQATITLARVVDAGQFTPPNADGTARPLAVARAFCRVAATLKPSSDSDIAIELWMPVSGWNGKFQAVGNGAFNGSIGYAALAAALDRGYAAASTDTGHVGDSGRFALGHPEKVVDFGWRAVHEMTVASKSLIAAYYDARPRLSYWNGCSAGGRQGLKEAQRFPSDFDGIVAGAPGLDWTSRAAQAVLVAKATVNPAARLLAPDRQLLHTAVVQACDALDGVKDGLIGDPTRCAFDPGVLQCRDGATSGCLTPAQVETARLIYTTQINPKTGRAITGLQRGSELGWTDNGWTASARASGLDQFRFIVFHDPGWTVDRFDLAADIVRAEETDEDTIDALDVDLRAFMERGGKLIQYHGWSDAQISPGNSTQYYARVLAALGGEANVGTSYRLFMAPGMGHCRGGEGPSSFDAVGALERWVEHSQAPDEIIASHATNGVVDRTRPLCPFPQAALYRGSGSMDEASSFVCRAP